MKTLKDKRKTKIIYVISDVDKALAFEWIVDNISKKIDIFFILIGNTDTALQFFLRKSHCDFVLITDNEYPSYWRKSIQVLNILLSKRPDIIHTHLWRATIIGIPMAWLVCIKKRIFTRHHAMIHYREFPSGRKWDRLLNKLATDIVAISENVKSILIDMDGADEKKIRTIPHGFDISYFENPDPEVIESVRIKYKLTPLTYPVIGVIARYVEWKGIQYIIEAFKTLRAEYPSAHLVLANAVGNYSPNIKTMLTALPEHTYTEIIFEQNLSALYRLFDVYVHTPVDQYSEAFGQTYVEALMAGVPSLVTISGVAQGLIIPNHNAIVVEYKNSDSIARGITKILNDLPFKNGLIKAGRSSIAEFTIEVMINRLENLYGIY